MATNTKLLEQSVRDFKKDSVNCKGCKVNCCRNTEITVSSKDISKLFSDVPVVRKVKGILKLTDRGESVIYSDGEKHLLINCPYLTREGSCEIYPKENRPDSRPKICSKAPLYLNDDNGVVTLAALNICPIILENEDLLLEKALFYGVPLNFYGDKKRERKFVPDGSEMQEIKILDLVNK